MTKMQGVVIIVLLALMTAGVVYERVNEDVVGSARWEYLVVTLPSDAKGRTGYRALEPSTVDIPGDTLKRLGDNRWELVTAVLENETVHPNFGNSEYVTGLQPNIRPQLVRLLFKRRRGFFTSDNG